MYVAALDTCVLWPSLQRDYLLSLAVANVFRPVWSDIVLEELEHLEAIKLARRQGLAATEASDRAARLIGRMRSAFEGATIDSWDRVKAVGLPDPDDEHVLGAAVVGQAQVIVTENHKDFPPALLPPPLRTEGAATFIDAMVVAQPSEASEALGEMSARRTEPAMSARDIVDLLDIRYGIHEGADVLRQWL